MRPDTDPGRGLARDVHRQLAALPTPTAPSTLLPRVLAAISRPWYARAWLTWPAGLKAASMVALVTLVAAASWIAAASPELSTASALVRIGWRLLLQPAVAHVFVMAVAISLLVSASWKALSRVALGGISE